MIAEALRRNPAAVINVGIGGRFSYTSIRRNCVALIDEYLIRIALVPPIVCAQVDMGCANAVMRVHSAYKRVVKGDCKHFKGIF